MEKVMMLIMYFPSSSKMAAIIDNMITEHYYQKELSDPLQQALFVQLLTYGVRKTYEISNVVIWNLFIFF